MTRARGRPAGSAQSFPRHSADRAAARSACPWTRGVRAWPRSLPTAAAGPGLAAITAQLEREGVRLVLRLLPPATRLKSAVGSLRRPYGMAAVLAPGDGQIGTAHAVTGVLAAEVVGAAGNGRSRCRWLWSSRSAVARGASPARRRPRARRPPPAGR